MKLYDYYRSTASYRVRIALHLKQIPYEKCPIHLINEGGEQHRSHYLELNPQGLVPTLDDNGVLLCQSLAIIDYLDEKYPTPPLLPMDPIARAHIKSLALIIACDVHPLNNLRVLQRLKTDFKATESQVEAWYHHWLKMGFDAFELKLQRLPRSKDVCYGSEISLADLCLIPQVFNANRFNFPMDDYPLIRRINDHCQTIKAFVEAAP
jgi:maleylacetoacetate isomerase